MKRDVAYLLYRMNTVTRVRQFVSQYPQYNLAKHDGETFRPPFHYQIEREPARQGVVV